VRPAVLGRRGIRAGDEHAPLRLVRERRPDLLTRDHPLVAVSHRPGLERGEVRAGVRLGEALAPDLVGGEDRREVALLLLIVAVGDNGRPAHGQAEDVGHLRRTGTSDLLIEDRLLDEARPRPTVRLGPGEAGPAAVVELALPVATEGERRLVALGLRARVVPVEPLAELVAELLLLR
jgi:hypothetical protein